MEIIDIVIYVFPASVILILFLFFAVPNAKKRKQIQNDIVNENRDLFATGIWFRVCYCSETRLKKIWTFFLWEATGILFIDNQHAVFIGNYLSGIKVKKEFNKENSSIDWIGMVSSRWNWSWLSWLLINSSGENHYFTSETGSLIFGSEPTTANIYDKLINIFKQKTWKRPPGIKTLYFTNLKTGPQNKLFLLLGASLSLYLLKHPSNLLPALDYRDRGATTLPPPVVSSAGSSPAI